MEKAIAGEDYESAARLRDEVAELEKQLTPS
jgi:protein-arginine kinase activator protein McsA